MTSKDIVYVNGDSFTQGNEIGNHLAPFFTKYHSLKELQSLWEKDAEKAKKSQEQYIKSRVQSLMKNDYLRKKITDYEENNRWSSTLEKIINRPVFNISSYGGSSVQAITYRSLTDLHILISQGYNVTDIIIQLTGPYRYSFFKNTLNANQPRNNYVKSPYNIISTNVMSPYQDEKEIAEQIFLIEDNYSKIRTLYEIYNLFCSFKLNFKSRLIFVDSLFYKPCAFSPDLYAIDKLLDQNHFLVNFKRKMDEEVELAMIDLINADEKDTMTDGFHFTTKVHTAFAEKIADRYFK